MSQAVATVSAELAAEQLAQLVATYPDADCELDFSTPLELLVATVLSAQSTDVGVNKVTPMLFAHYPDARSYAEADRAELEELIHPTGFFRNKAAALMGIGRVLVDDFEGVVPSSLADLVTLPGVGRKTANVVLGHAFGIPGVTPDTHVMRVARRLGWTASTKPDGVEADLSALFAQPLWTRVSDTLIFHGRRCCHAKKPACGACPVAATCPSFGIGPTAPDEAKALVKDG